MIRGLEKCDTRLANIGFIKSVSPIFDFDLIEENTMKPKLEIQGVSDNRNDKVARNETEKK